MIDVKEWQWQNKEAEDLQREGARSIVKGMMMIFVTGIDEVADRNRAIESLETGVRSLEETFQIERPPIPLPYTYLSEGYTFLGFCKSYGTGTQSDETRELLVKAKGAADTAIELYDNTTGWDPGLRHDFHFSVAYAHFDLGEITQAKEQLKEARTYLRENSLLGEKALHLEAALGVAPPG